jgi:hypothetical protein
MFAGTGFKIIYQLRITTAQINCCCILCASVHLWQNRQRSSTYFITIAQAGRMFMGVFQIFAGWCPYQTGQTAVVGGDTDHYQNEVRKFEMHPMFICTAFGKKPIFAF